MENRANPVIPTKGFRAIPLLDIILCESYTRLMYNERVVLGLLMDGARHGYDRQRLIKKRHMDEYINLAASSMYKELNRLQTAGKIESHPETVGSRPERQVYHITPQGEERLKDLLRTMLHTFEPYYDPLNAALTFARYIEPNEVREALQARRDLCLKQLHYQEEVIEQVRSFSNQYGRDPFYSNALLRGGIKMAEAYGEWLEEIIKDLEERV